MIVFAWCGIVQRINTRCIITLKLRVYIQHSASQHPHLAHHPALPGQVPVSCSVWPWVALCLQMLRPASRGRVQGRDQSGFYSRGSYEQGATMQANASECSFSYFVGFRGTFGFKNCILFFSFLLLFLNMSKIISVVGDSRIRNLVSTWQENVAKNVIRVF